ncbi:type II toxin-antitoxin system VapC family toxin [Candidatus Electronema sp. TJ]|uniref:type II toxin-antitoxin system VapC family toxin n=1 Tax=Candidatus Electronema sp. TJ TaxID=3401573 RepID=UPI003AA8918F
MNNLFADTSGWGCLIDATQKHHALAAAIYRNIRQQQARLITTNYIITELAALMSSPLHLPRPSIIAFLEGIKTSPYVAVIHIDQTLDEQVWRLYKQRTDKDWSLVDCASFVVMKERGITESLTTEHHFEQAGFLRLLK